MNKTIYIPCKKCPACAGFPGYGNECAYWKTLPLSNSWSKKDSQSNSWSKKDSQSNFLCCFGAPK
jgi:hypothetical protein